MSTKADLKKHIDDLKEFNQKELAKLRKKHSFQIDSLRAKHAKALNKRVNEEQDKYNNHIIGRDNAFKQRIEDIKDRHNQEVVILKREKIRLETDLEESESKRRDMKIITICIAVIATMVVLGIIIK